MLNTLTTNEIQLSVGSSGVAGGLLKAGKVKALISAHCASRLAGYKGPTEVRVVRQLPLTSAQKLDRIALRRGARNEQEPSSGIG